MGIHSLPMAATAAGLAMSAGAVSARAALLAYEPFDYPAGILGGPAGGVNLTGDYALSAVPPGFELRVASPGLSYGSLTGAPPVAGNRLSQNLGTTAAEATATLGDDALTGPGTATYFSALFTFDDSANGNHLANVTLADGDTGDYVRFGQASVGIRALRVEADTTATGEHQAETANAFTFTDEHTLLLLGRYVNAAAADGDRLELVGYDTADAVALPATFDPADPAARFSIALDDLDIDLAKIDQVRFAIRGAGNNFIDEFRLGSTYADVVPEPAGALVTAAAGALALTRRRGRRRRE